MFLEEIDMAASLRDVETSLLSLQGELLPEFHAEDWALSWKTYFDLRKSSSQIDPVPEDVSYLGWLLEELINWVEVARHRKAKRKAKGKPPLRALRRMLQSSRCEDPPSAVRIESDAAAKTESDTETETESAQGRSHRTAGELPRFSPPLSRLSHTDGIRR